MLELHSNLIQQSINHFKNGNIAESKKIAIDILDKSPENTDANYILGIIANSEENYDEALFYFEHVVARIPKDPEVWNHLAITLIKKERYDEAITNFKKSLDLGSLNKINIFNNIVLSIFQRNRNLMNKDYSDVVYYCKRILEIDTNNFAALNNLALANIYELNYNEAIKILKKVLKLDPSSINANQNMGLAYKYKNDYAKAESFYKKTLFLTKSNANKRTSKVLSRHNISITLGEVQLSQLKFVEGWPNFINKSSEKNNDFLQIASKPRWNPDMGHNQNILIVGQFGLGEQILFSSILPEARIKFTKIIFAIDKRLLNLMNSLYPNISFIDKKFIQEEYFDCFLPMTSLGLLFRNSINDFLLSQNILNQQKFEKTKVNKTPKLKCAISWKSNNPEFGSLKSLDFNSLVYLSSSLKKMDIEFYNIQYTNEKEDLDRLKNEYGIDIKTIDGLDTLNNITGLSDFIETCDFTINISNTNAHLSAALNKKTYLLLSKGVGTLWYWENNYKNKNIWYSSIEIFRQVEERNWRNPIDNLLHQIKKDFSL